VRGARVARVYKCIAAVVLMSLDAQKTDVERKEDEEAEILAAIANRKQLASDRDLAQGISYTEALKSSCVP